MLLSSHPPHHAGTYYVGVLSLCKEAGIMKVWIVFIWKGDSHTALGLCFHPENGDKSKLWESTGKSVFHLQTCQLVSAAWREEGIMELKKHLSASLVK